MRDGVDARGGVTEEELRALLRDDEDAAAEEASAGPRGHDVRVLIASRRTRDVALLLERLRARGVDVDGVRGGFRALDLLRARRYAAIVSDLELWAGGGALLVDRIRNLDPRPAVIFLGERSTGGPTGMATPAGVAVLPCPLSAREADLGAETVAAAARRAPQEAVTVAPGIGDVQGRRGDGEIAWLRFFLEGGRLVRASGNADDFRRGVVRLVRDVLGAGAAGVGFGTGGAREIVSVARDSGSLGELAVVIDASSGGGGDLDLGSLRVEVAGEHLVVVRLPTAVAALVAEHEADLVYLLAEGLGS